MPAPLYCFSFEPNPDWSRRFAAAPEIQAYTCRCADKCGITRQVRLGTRVARARFDAASGCWCIGTERGEQLRARFFVCSTGPLSQARYSGIDGLDCFRGQLLHSARWRPDADVTGQRVAVIGTGSSASQLAAPLAEQARQLYVFQRTANWVLPRIDRPYTALDRALAHVPLYAALVREFWCLVLEWGRRGFEDGTLARRGMLGAARAHLRRQVSDEALRQRLCLPYPLGCRRIIYSNDFYPALTRPDVERVTESIARITPHGIVTADGRERPIDTLVCATGFDTVQLLSSLTVTGLDGGTLRDAWRNGPEAYRGVTVAGFPNLFLLLGPNAGTGHTSTLLYIVEPEMRYAIACMRAVKARGARWIDVRPEALRAHNERLQKRLAGSVWTRCRSWYRMDSGKVVALGPGFRREYVAALRRPEFADYVFG